MTSRKLTAQDLEEFGVKTINSPSNRNVGANVNNASVSNTIPEAIKAPNSSSPISAPNPAQEPNPVVNKKVPVPNEVVADCIANTKVEEVLDLGAESFSSVYAGDTIDNSAPLRPEGFITDSAFAFESPSELHAFYNKAINSGEVTQHRWQVEFNESLAFARPTSLKPHKNILCACNGSGKDAFVVAPFAVWFILTKVKARVIITSSSGVQLTAQTEHYIAELARKINEFHNEQIFKVTKRYIKCRLTGSEIRLFATDEEGKAEGYHPIEPNAEMAIIINEGKSVATEIYRALRRCTGFNYWLEVSTPGQPVGDFYYHFTRWEFKRKVDYTQCPHLSEEERLSDIEELGEDSSWYRSKYLAEFTSIDGSSIIPLEVIERLKQLALSNTIVSSYQSWPIRIGIDLAAGGDETSCYACKGNRILKRLNFREKDTTVTASRIDHWLSEELGINKGHNFIYGDDGGVGKGVLDMLNSNYGWNIARVNNQSPASDKKRYINRGAENWYRVKRILEENKWLFTKEDINIDGGEKKLLNQLATRFYKQQSTQGRIALEAKADAKAHGRPSPDRADAFILSFTGLTIDDFTGVKVVESDKKSRKQETQVATSDVPEWYEDNVTYGEYEGKSKLAISREGRRANGSINSLMRHKTNRSNSKSSYAFN